MKIISNLCFTIFIVTCLVFPTSFSENRKRDCIRLLASNNFKLWDAKCGNNWLFMKNRVFMECEYSDDKQLKKVTIPDVIVNEMNWSCKNDTIYIYYAPQIVYKYPIIRLNEKQLIVKDLNKHWGRDTLVFYRANSQMLPL